MGSEAKVFYEFGPFRMDPGRSLLLKAGEPIALTSKAFETLLILVVNSQQVVSKDELMKRLWPDTFVEESNLTQHISMVRKALGETAQEHRYIVTLPGRGYRFAEPVRMVPQEGADLTSASPPMPTAVLEQNKAGGWRLRTARVLLGLVLVGGLAAAIYFARPRSKAVSIQRRVMLAVLPFQNLSNDPEQEYFSDGLTEETITDLGTLNPKRLGVIARTSAMAYKHTNETVGQIGQELRVDYILEGAVRREGTRARISAQLIRVKDQTHIWAQSYDRDLQDFLAVQNELGDAITKQIEVSLAPEQQQAQTKALRINPQAYDDYLRGRSLWNQSTPESLRKSIEFFQRAIARDPGYAPAYAGLAGSYGVLMDWNKLSPTEAYAKSEAAARKAVELDGGSSEAHAALGWQLLSYDRDFPGAESEFRRAIELNTSNADAHEGLANYYAVRGRFDPSIAEMKKALELDPLSLVVNGDLGKMLFYARRYDPAIQQLQSTLEIHPDSFGPHYVLSLVYQAEGRYEQAYEETFKELTSGGTDPFMAEVQKSHAKFGWKGAWQLLLAKRRVSTWDLAGLALALGDKEQTLVLLQNAADEHLSQVIFLNVDPRYDSLRSDPRFQDLLRHLGLRS